ncbi:unnamed protein product [Ixodes persulcatus]
MVSAFSLAPAVATDILLKKATSMNEYTMLNGRKGASLQIEGVKIVPFQQNFCPRLFNTANKGPESFLPRRGVGYGRTNFFKGAGRHQCGFVP